MTGSIRRRGWDSCQLRVYCGVDGNGPPFDFGNPITNGAPAEIRASETVRSAYLGHAVIG